MEPGVSEQRRCLGKSLPEGEQRVCLRQERACLCEEWLERREGWGLRYKVRSERWREQLLWRLEALARKEDRFTQKELREEEAAVVNVYVDTSRVPQTGLPCSAKLSHCPSPVLPNFSPSVAAAGEVGVL